MLCGLQKRRKITKNCSGQGNRYDGQRLIQSWFIAVSLPLNMVVIWQLRKHWIMKFCIWLIRCIMLFMCIPLIGFFLWFCHGSLEMFPIEERHEASRIFTGFFIISILTIEGILFLIQKKMHHHFCKNLET